MSEQSVWTHGLVFFPYTTDIKEAITNDQSIDPAHLTKISTYDDLGLIPSSKPFIKLPEYKQNFVDILGKNGSIDATEILGSVMYANRQDTIEFYVREYPIVNGVRLTFEQLKRVIANFLHGKELCVYLESDPEVFYAGRWAIDDMHTEESWSLITLSYTLETYGYYFTVPQTGERRTL